MVILRAFGKELLVSSRALLLLGASRPRALQGRRRLERGAAACRETVRDGARKRGRAAL